MNRHLGISFVALIATMVLGCSRHWAEQISDFEASCWSVTDTISLKLDNQDTNQVYRLSFPLTVTEEYPFHNIYLRVQILAPSGDLSVVPAEFQLADPTGAWLTETKGDQAIFQLVLANGMRFNQPGLYQLRLYHFMRDERLCGVKEAGMVLDLAESN